ncbi:MAG: CoF synthetase, partial [Urechidicola sp.]|nr:CoF synthetase [Urechidicola sp.]
SLIRNFHQVSVFDFDDSDIEKLLNKIRNSKTKVAMLGYATSFEKICKYMDRTKREPIKGKVNSIISMSERLSVYTKNSIKKYFDETIVSRYSNSEQGMIAQEEISAEGRFKINCASYFVELVDMEIDAPAKLGNYGRIVVTDLFNFSIPLIRYDTGDVAKIEEYKNENEIVESYLTNIEGRKNDLIYNTSGEIVPSEVSYLMTKYGEFKQFQFVQCGEKEYRLKINTDKKVLKENELIEMYKTILGADANVKIEYVDGIPVLGSGKKKEVLNTYKNPV